ncbi:MAG TPA: hypothetical protein VJ723_01640 [Candidatus Angelobacter sp.]|nr:hypothetical protein [Candidatus Angelobacter sp.]
MIARDRVIGKSKPTAAEGLCGTAALGCVVAVRWSFALFHTIRTTLREIFDENAYDRFLVRTQEVRSVDSYRKFMNEREAGMAKRPRCC